MSRRVPKGLLISLDNGDSLDLSRRRDDGDQVRVDVRGSIAPHFFDACPICGAPATDDEHVPPASMGGRVMTRTCGPCNNALGSRVERDLADWLDGALTLPAFSGDAVPGRRRAARLLFWTTADGAFVLAVDGKADPAIRDLLVSGEIDLSALVPDENRFRLALLKHAYLAACLHFGMPPAEAEGVRLDLIAARDAPNRESVPVSVLALGLDVLRLDPVATVALPPVCLAVAHTDNEPTPGVILGGTVFVSWASDPIRATRERRDGRVGASMKIGPRVEGVITDVAGPQSPTRSVP